MTTDFSTVFDDLEQSRRRDWLVARIALLISLLSLAIAFWRGCR